MFLLNKVGYFIFFMLSCSALSLRSLSHLRFQRSIKSFSLNTNNDAIIAIDYSGSTDGSSYYWERIQRLLDEHKSARIMFWNTNIDSSPSAESVRKVSKLTTTL